MVKKKKGKIARVAKMLKDGMSIQEVAEKMGLSQRVVRAYKWRAENVEKYKALLGRYYSKKKQRKEIEEVKQTVDEQKKKEEV